MWNISEISEESRKQWRSGWRRGTVAEREVEERLESLKKWRREEACVSYNRSRNKWERQKPCEEKNSVSDYVETEMLSLSLKPSGKRRHLTLRRRALWLICLVKRRKPRSWLSEEKKGWSWRREVFREAIQLTAITCERKSLNTCVSLSILLLSREMTEAQWEKWREALCGRRLYDEILHKYLSWEKKQRRRRGLYVKKKL